MSLVNIVVRPDRIFVAVDTDCFDVRTAQHNDGSKLLALPHVNAVIAGRGHLTLLYVTLHNLLDPPVGQDFDAMGDALPDLLTGVRRTLIAQDLLVGGDGGQDIFFAGWSARNRRLQALHYVLQDDVFVLLDEIITGRVAPGKCFTELPPSFATSRPDDLIKVAQEQVRWMRGQSPTVGAGGRLIVAEVTRNRMSITSAASL